MVHSQYDPVMQNKTALNSGKMVGTKWPLTQNQIAALTALAISAPGSSAPHRRVGHRHRLTTR